MAWGCKAMLIFIDTEFTDFKDAELISIGLVTEDGDEFYAELPVDQSKCNNFVLTTILPQLGKMPDVRRTPAQLRDKLQQWLEKFQPQAPVVICFDYDGDWRLFCAALANEVPSWVSGRNIYKYIDQPTWLMYFIENKLSEHHALNDAKANRHACNIAQARTDPMQFRNVR